MKPNAFIGWSQAPTNEELSWALGRVRPLWDEVVEGIASELGLTGREWKCSARKYGWSLRLQQGKRTILHLSPCRGQFRVGCILGDRAIEAALASRPGAAVVKLLDGAPRYPEGTGIRFEVTNKKQISLIRKLARIKLEN